MSEQQGPHGGPDAAPPRQDVPGSATPPPESGERPPPEPGGRLVGVDNFFDSIRRMGVRRSTDRWIGGVAAGIAERLGVDPLLIRAVLFVSLFIGGAGLALYGIAWAILPERSDGRILLQEAVRGDVDIAMVGILAMVIVGLSSDGIGTSWWDATGLGWISDLLWVAVVATTAWLVVTSAKQKRKRKAGQPAATAPPAGDPASYIADPAAYTTDPVAYRVGPAAYPAPASWTAAQDAPVTDDPSPYGAPSQGIAPRPDGRSHKPPKPPKRPRAQGPGRVITGIVVGLSLLAGAALLLIYRFGGDHMPITDRNAAALVWLAGSLLLVGAGIVISGLRGRRSGILGLLAIVGLLVAIPSTSSVTDEHWVGTDANWARADPQWVVTSEPGVDSGGHADGYLLLNGTQVITDRTVAQDGLMVGFGSPTYDLTHLDLTGVTSHDPVTVPVGLGMGSAKIIVPDGIAVEARVTVGTGNAHWHVDGTDHASDGAGQKVTWTSQEATPDGAVLILDVEIGAGDLTITEG